MIISKIYRFFFSRIKQILSFLRIIHLRLKYSGIRIDLNSDIGSGTFIMCEDNSKLNIESSFISDGAYIVAKSGGEINISQSFIGRNTVIVAMESININNHCQISEMVVIRDQDHKFDTPDIPVGQQGFNVMPIEIGANVWLGSKVTVLKGVNIGTSAVIGSNAVVTKDIPSRSVFAGIPAKQLR